LADDLKDTTIEALLRKSDLEALLGQEPTAVDSGREVPPPWPLSSLARYTLSWTCALLAIPVALPAAGELVARADHCPPAQRGLQSAT
jgi:hypothetical protein